MADTKPISMLDLIRERSKRGNHKAGGAKAQRNGLNNEKLLMIAARPHLIYLIRIPDGCRRIGPSPKDLIRVKSPFDYTGIFEDGTPIWMDAKNRDQQYSLKLDESTYNQAMILRELARRGGRAGFYIRCARINRHLWISAHLIRADEKSILWRDDRFVDCGSLDEPLNFEPIRLMGGKTSKEANYENRNPAKAETVEGQSGKGRSLKAASLAAAGRRFEEVLFKRVE